MSMREEPRLVILEKEHTGDRPPARGDAGGPLRAGNRHGHGDTMTTTPKAKAPRLTKGQQRRATIETVLKALEGAAGPIEDAISPLEDLKAELEEMRDNLEERFSGTERYQAVSEAVDALESAIERLADARDGIDEASGELDGIETEW